MISPRLLREYDFKLVFLYNIDLKPFKTQLIVIKLPVAKETSGTILRPLRI